jgi:hypothetical protein
MRHGSALCRELIGYNLSNPEEFKRAQEDKAFEEKCSNFIRGAIEILLELVKN